MQPPTPRNTFPTTHCMRSLPKSFNHKPNRCKRLQILNPETCTGHVAAQHLRRSPASWHRHACAPNFHHLLQDIPYSYRDVVQPGGCLPIVPTSVTCLGARFQAQGTAVRAATPHSEAWAAPRTLPQKHPQALQSRQQRTKGGV